MTCNGAFMALILMSLANYVAAAPQPVREMAMNLQPGGHRNVSAGSFVPREREPNGPATLASLTAVARAPDAHAQRLDLRLVSEERADFGRAGRDTSLYQRASTAGGGDDERFKDLDAAYARGMKAEALEARVNRARHEGLPIARLWENKSALVSLGLNGRGKPGIWLVQKIH